MLVKKLVLSNFKSHSNSIYHFGRTNHFFGDNFTGKSSIGDAIVYCLFGLSRHGYKSYSKDYLQDGAATMSVEMDVQINDQEYCLKRKMNSKGTSTLFMNQNLVKEKDLEKLIGQYNTFVYCFFPEFFPGEDKKNARTYIIDLLFTKKNDYEELEKEQARIIRQQKNITSSITFYEGQRLLLKKQTELLKVNSSHTPRDISFELVKLQNKLNTIMNELQNQQTESIELKSLLKIDKEQLFELEAQAPLTVEKCPTCYQPVSNEQVSAISLLKSEKRDHLNKEIEGLERQIENNAQHRAMLLNKKSTMEEKLKKLKNYSSQNHNIEYITQQLNELIMVETKLSDLVEKKSELTDEAKRLKHQLGVTANTYQNKINDYLSFTRIDLFKQLKNGELRPDFQISYKNRPYRVLSNSEKVRCAIEIISLLNRFTKGNFPLFLDNLESVTHLDPPADVQIFTATVKKGVPLTLKVKEW